MSASVAGRTSNTATSPKPAISIIEALDDPNLFGPHFGGDSWKPWRTYLKTLFALPMDDAELATFQRHTGRQQPPTALSTYSALICGRRAGKSRIMALLAIWAACFRSYGQYMAPGEKITIMVLSANRHQSRIVMRYISGALNSIPLLKPLIQEELQESIGLSNGVVIEVATASYRTARGSSVACCVCDEIAFWRGEDSANPDFEVIRAIRPGMANIPGAMLILASSPHAKRGVLFDVWKKNYGQEDARVLV